MDIQTVKDGEFPFYQKDESRQAAPARPKLSDSTQQGQGSGLNADTIQGIQAVTAKVAGPNKLVATNALGVLPTTTMPGTSGVFVISGVTYTLTNGVVTSIV